MNRYGIIIIKPDFIKKRLILEVLRQIDKESLHILEVYKINNFKNYSIAYRKHEQLKKNLQNCDNQKIKAIFSTIIGYELKYKNIALLFVINNKDCLEDKQFFDKLLDVKKEIRNNFVKQREYCDFLFTGYGETKLITEKFSTYEELSKVYGDKISLVYFNGIHLEDYEDFINQLDYNFAVDYGVISSENKIDMHNFKQMFQNLGEYD